MDNENQTLDSFVAKLVEEKGLGGLEPELKEQVQKDLLVRVEDHVNAAILNNLPTEKLPEFNTILDAGDLEAIKAYIETAVPNSSNIVAETLLSFRTAYLNR